MWKSAEAKHLDFGTQMAGSSVWPQDKIWPLENDTFTICRDFFESIRMYSRKSMCRIQQKLKISTLAPKIQGPQCGLKPKSGLWIRKLKNSGQIF